MPGSWPFGRNSAIVDRMILFVSGPSSAGTCLIEYAPPPRGLSRGPQTLCRVMIAEAIGSDISLLTLVNSEIDESP